MLRAFRKKCSIFVTFPSPQESACARNAEPANVSELLSSYTALFVLLCLDRRSQKRLACQRFSATRHLNLSSSSSSVKSSENPSIKNVALALAKACFSEASTQRGDSGNYSIVSLSLPWLTTAPHSVSTGVTEPKT